MDVPLSHAHVCGLGITKQKWIGVEREKKLKLFWQLIFFSRPQSKQGLLMKGMKTPPRNSKFSTPKENS